MIRSKFSLLVYTTTLILSILIALGVYLLINPELRIKTRFSEIDGVTLPGLILVGVGGVLLLTFLKRVFVFTIFNDHLDLLTIGGRQVLKKEDILLIDLQRREKIFGHGADVITITTIYGNTLILPEMLCRNMPDIKQMLSSWYRDLIVGRPAIESWNRPVYTGETEFFRGNPVLNFHGLGFFGTLAVLIWWCADAFAGRSDRQWPYIFLTGGLLLFVARMFGGELCYFILSSDQLEIRNHVFPWYRKIFELEDISDVVFAFASKRAYSLRICTTGQRTYSFGGGSLRGDDWREMEKAFHKRRIMVRNELPGI